MQFHEPEAVSHIINLLNDKKCRMKLDFAVGRKTVDQRPSHLNQDKSLTYNISVTR